MAFRLGKHQTKCLEAYATATQVSREEYLDYMREKLEQERKDRRSQ